MQPSSFASIPDAAAWFGAWLREAALPLWSTAGFEQAQGAFQEAVTVEGLPVLAPRRGRVQARQTWVYATVHAAGFPGDWLSLAWRGFDYYKLRYQLPDGLFARLADLDGHILDATPAVYEQAFSLLAMAALHKADPHRGDLITESRRTRNALASRHAASGGFREFGEHPFQANAHMHLLEACLAWEEAGQSDWAELSDEIALLGLNRFIDPERGFLREFFDDRWRPLAAEGGLVEPGHQFEWAWLMDRWGRRRGRDDAVAAARGLYAAGLQGVDPYRDVAVNALWEDLSVRDATARLWPQTEYLKAALLFGSNDEALRAAQGLARYLDTPARGAWRDKMLVDGAFCAEPAPATSFYHVLGAVLPLIQAGGSS